MRLLLIENDTLLGNGIQAGLTQANYMVDWVTDGEAGEHALKIETFDALILDLSLPDGLITLKNLRIRGDTIPVLILTTGNTTDDKVIGLDNGADGYLLKPFNLDELNACLRTLLHEKSGQTTSCIEYGNLYLDPTTRTLTKDGQPVKISQREFSILQTLLENIGKILPRSRLEDNLYGWNNAIESNAVEVHIHHLRKKLGKELIRTLRGRGYMVPNMNLPN
ncbi:winged helix-turn-helix domain-containing protein [Candidatus Parabeggiatoa sp. HSG14]|uniref:winged helix-turn-helix domain-containing protein n=1 Tax=Candidatus Parabeggiatoa sp. HSG14 TaxID=3055593 RepID=UPI0025A77B18|nr:winged helix-turn-helix domain-containing protein [Thiotrichales bacterium HSG14]